MVGCLFRCAACLVQVLYALNERYFVNEKGSARRRTHSHFIRPTSGRFSTVLARPKASATELNTSVRRFDELVRAAQDLLRAVEEH